MAYCSECAKLEDAAEAATLEYDELLIQQNRSGEPAQAGSVDHAISSAREKRDLLRKQLSEHKAVHL